MRMRYQMCLLVCRLTLEAPNGEEEPEADLALDVINNIDWQPQHHTDVR